MKNKTALKEFYRLSLLEKKRKLENIEKTTKNGILYFLKVDGLTINDLTDEEKSEIERKVKNEIRR